MSPIAALLILAAPSIGPSIGDHFDHAGGGPDPHYEILVAPKVPDCRTEAQIQKALAEKADGIMPQSCDLPKSRLRTAAKAPKG